MKLLTKKIDCYHTLIRFRKYVNKQNEIQKHTIDTKIPRKEIAKYLSCVDHPEQNRRRIMISNIEYKNMQNSEDVNFS